MSKVILLLPIILPITLLATAYGNPAITELTPPPFPPIPFIPKPSTPHLTTPTTYVVYSISPPLCVYNLTTRTPYTYCWLIVPKNNVWLVRYLDALGLMRVESCDYYCYAIPVTYLSYILPVVPFPPPPLPSFSYYLHILPPPPVNVTIGVPCSCDP